MHFEKIKEINNILPKYEILSPLSEVDYYGFSSSIASNIGVKDLCYIKVNWKHAWIYTDLQYTEQLIVNSKAKINVVANLEQKAFLKKHSIDALVLGSPFAYVHDYDQEKIKRIPKSLLVMPPHSLPYTNHSFDENRYVKEIIELKEDFDFIAVCIHRSCVNKDLWVKSFKKQGISIIVGADTLDKNGFLRMSRIFSSFEYMTTNTIGSHILYASYSGCKVSIYGTYIEYSKLDFVDDPFYNKRPYMLDYNLEQSSHQKIREKYQFFFISPIKSRQNIEWANNEIGKENMVTSFDIAKLFGIIGYKKYFYILKFKTYNIVRNSFLYGFLKSIYTSLKA